MKIFFYFFLLFILNINAFALSIDIDSKLSYDKVRKEEFTINTQKNIGLGIVPNTTLWIKFKLTNQTDKPLSKILEYDNPEKEDLYFHDGNMVIVDGML